MANIKIDVTLTGERYPLYEKATETKASGTAYALWVI